MPGRRAGGAPYGSQAISKEIHGFADRPCDRGAFVDQGEAGGIANIPRGSCPARNHRLHEAGDLAAPRRKDVVMPFEFVGVVVKLP